MKLYPLVEGDIQIETEFELGKRLGFGSLSHVLLFSVILFATPFMERHFWLAVAVGPALVIISIARFFLSRLQPRLYPKNRKTWLLLFDISMVITASLWGLLCEEILRLEGFTSSLSMVILLVTSGLTAGAANSLNPSFKRGVTFVALTLGIPFGFLISAALAKTPLTGAFATIFLIYFTFLSMQIRSQYEIFWNLLRTKKGITDMNHALEKEIRERKEQSRFIEAFFKLSPYGLNLCTMQGQWVESNPAFAQIIGYSEEETNSGKLTYWQLTPPEYAEQEKVQLEKLASTKRYGPYEKHFIRKDGQHVAVRLNGFLIEKDGTEYIWSVIEDMTRERVLENKLHVNMLRMQSIADSIPIFLAEIDEQNTFTWCNKAFVETYGDCTNTRVHTSLKNLASGPNDQGQIEMLLSPHKKGWVDVSLRSKGRTMDTSWSMVAIGAENKKVLIGQDISDIKKYIDQLRQATAVAESARDEATAANLAKSTFLANMSHELRTPMHGILSYAQFGIQKFRDATPEKLQSYFLEIFDCGQRLLTLLNDLLDLAKLESGKMTYQIQTSSLSSVIKTVLAEMSAFAETKKIQLRFEEPKFSLDADMDHERITQVLRNLTSNAIKFSTPGNQVILSATENENSLECVVQNIGVGIPQDELESIFDKFTQSKLTRNGSGGTGLGLAICREIINFHGGKIWAESQQDGLTRLVFQIPKQHIEKKSA